MAVSKKRLAFGTAVSLPAIAAIAFVANSVFDSASADIGPIPFPAIPILGGAAAATPTGSPSASPSVSPSVSPSASPSASPSVSPSVSPSPTVSPTPTIYPSPVLTQNNAGGHITFTFRVNGHFANKTVYFFRKSGMTGKVAPLGTATVGGGGFALRSLDAKRGQIIRAYGKIMDAPDIQSPYSNDVAFKVQ